MDQMRKAISAAVVAAVGIFSLLGSEDIIIRLVAAVAGGIAMGVTVYLVPNAPAPPAAK